MEVAELEGNYGGYGGGYGQSRFDKADPFQNSYSTPGWQRAQQNRSMQRATTGVRARAAAWSALAMARPIPASVRGVDR